MAASTAFVPSSLFNCHNSLGTVLSEFSQQNSERTVPSELRLQVGVFAGDVVDRGAILHGIEVVVAHDHGTGITCVEFFEQRAERSLLRLGTRVGGLTADVEPALVADADRVGVVFHAVGSDPPFRTACLPRSVTADHVVVADTILPMVVLAMPLVDLVGRTRLVGLYCRTVNDNHCNRSHAVVKLTVLTRRCN